MCDPITATVASAALGLASSGMTAMANKSASEQQNRLQQEAAARSKKMRDEEFARQDAMRKENQQTLDQTTQRYDPNSQLQQVQQTGQERTDEAQKFADDAASMSPDAAKVPTSNTANNVIGDDLQKRLAIAAQKSRAKIAAFAKLGGYDENFSNNALADAAGNRQINLVNNLRGGSLASTNAGVGLVNNNVGKVNPVDLTYPAIAGGLGKVIAGDVQGGIYG